MTIKVYGTAIGKLGSDLSCVAIAEDGREITSHICSNPSFMQYDLHDRKQEEYKAAFPDGDYEFILEPNPMMVPDAVWEAGR